jgi:hypothetical protein
MVVADRGLMNFVLTVLRCLMVLNLLCAVIFVAVLGASIFAESTIREALVERSANTDAAALLLAARISMALGLVAVPLAQVLLTRLKAIVETVRAGDPFVQLNADRLKLIAWCLLGLQLCDLVFGVVSYSVVSGGEPMSGWTVSLTGWLAVALLFVLAQVFAHGTRMRDELEGTV